MATTEDTTPESRLARTLKSHPLVSIAGLTVIYLIFWLVLVFIAVAVF